MRHIILYCLAFLLHRFTAATLFQSYLIRNQSVRDLPDLEHTGTWFPTCRIPNVSDSEYIWFWTYLIPNLSEFEPIWFRTHVIPTLSDSKPIWYWTYEYLIPNLPIWYRTYLSDSEPNRYEPISYWTIRSWTYQIPNLRPVWGDPSVLPQCSYLPSVLRWRQTPFNALWRNKQWKKVNPSPPPPTSLRWPPNHPCVPCGEIGTKRSTSVPTLPPEFKRIFKFPK